jgi:hypothetical protein
VLGVEEGAIAADHETLGRYVLCGDGDPALLFCENEPNARHLWGADGAPFPKDGIGDHIVHGPPTVNPARTGTKDSAKAEKQLCADLGIGETVPCRPRDVCLLRREHAARVRQCAAAPPSLSVSWAARSCSRAVDSPILATQPFTVQKPDPGEMDEPRLLGSRSTASR